MNELTKKLSIIVCTYNNAGSLSKTLEQLHQSHLGHAADTEVIVVDNNSSDDTPAVLAKYSDRFRTLREPRQGLSHARNTGLATACGDYVLFTDDDAEIPKTWISTYIKVIDEARPDSIFSKILVIWDNPLPWWYDDRYRGYFAHLDYGDRQEVITDPRREFYGKNFCVRKQVLETLGGFDPKLGRSGKRLLAGEESVIFRKLITENHKIIYTPDAPVGHRLKDREYDERNIQKQMIDMAISNYHMARTLPRAKVFGRPVFVLRQCLQLLPRHARGWLVNVVRRNQKEAFFHKLKTLSTARLLMAWIGN